MRPTCSLDQAAVWRNFKGSRTSRSVHITLAMARFQTTKYAKAVYTEQPSRAWVSKKTRQRPGSRFNPAVPNRYSGLLGVLAGLGSWAACIL
jgi:hypothetical protein